MQSQSITCATVPSVTGGWLLRWPLWRILTFVYFIPTMIGLMNASDSPAAVAAAERWMRLNYLRHALVLLGHRSAPPSATAFLTILARPARPSGARTVALEPNGTSFAPSVMEVL